MVGMDPALGTLAMTAANVLVELLATDGWVKVKSAVGALWGHASPTQAAAAEEAATETRAALLAAGQAGDRSAQHALVAEWESRLTALLLADPGLQDQLREAVARLNHRGPRERIEMRARASGRGRIYQAGGDQRIIER